MTEESDRAPVERLSAPASTSVQIETAAGRFTGIQWGADGRRPISVESNELFPTRLAAAAARRLLIAGAGASRRRLFAIKGGRRHVVVVVVAAAAWYWSPNRRESRRRRDAPSATANGRHRSAKFGCCRRCCRRRRRRSIRGGGCTSPERRLPLGGVVFKLFFFVSAKRVADAVAWLFRYGKRKKTEPRTLTVG